MPEGDQVQMTAEEELAAVRAQMATLEAERDAAVQRAEDEARRADGLHGQVLDGTRKLAETGVQSLALQEQQAEATVGAVTGELRDLRSQYSALMAEGKFDEAAEVNEKIADAAARRNSALQAKAYYGQQKTQAAAQPTDPVERFFAMNNFTPDEKEWIRRNPRYATEDGFRERVNAAHAAATQAGKVRGSAEYYQELERAGYQRPAPQAQTPHQPPVQRRQVATGGEIPEDVDPGNPFSDAADLEEESTVQTPQRPAPRQAAAPPSRRSPTSSPRQNQPAAQLTPEQADTALKNADLAPIEIQNQGDAAILKWWAELNSSPTATRLRQEWAGV